MSVWFNNVRCRSELDRIEPEHTPAVAGQEQRRSVGEQRRIVVVGEQRRSAVAGRQERRSRSKVPKRIAGQIAAGPMKLLLLRLLGWRWCKCRSAGWWPVRRLRWWKQSWPMLGWLVAAGCWIDQPERMTGGCWAMGLAIVGFDRHRPEERSSFRRVQGFPGCWSYQKQNPSANQRANQCQILISH